MRTRHLRVLSVVTCLAAALAGCADAITVWPVAHGNHADVDVPPLAGHWRTVDDTDVITLEVGHVPGEHGTCRGGPVTFAEGDDVTHIGDLTCFVNIAGYLLVESRTVAPTAGFYRQYLVRIDADRIEVCGAAPVWLMFAELQKQGPVGFSLDTLQYTLRDQESGDLMVLISRPEPMREFLATALPELVALCDLGANDMQWIAFERYEPEPAPPANE